LSMSRTEHGQAQRQCRRDPLDEVVHFIEPSDASTVGGRRMPVRDARAPSGLARRPCGVRCFGVDALGRLRQNSRPEMPESRTSRWPTRAARRPPGMTWPWPCRCSRRRRGCTCLHEPTHPAHRDHPRGRDGEQRS
jgi:hypothetical protein